MANAGTGEPLLTLSVQAHGPWIKRSPEIPAHEQQSGMTLLEVLLAMSIFTAVL